MACSNSLVSVPDPNQPQRGSATHRHSGSGAETICSPTAQTHCQLVLPIGREMVVFKEGDAIYHSKVLSFFRKEHFKLEACYANLRGMPYPNPLIGKCHRSPFEWFVPSFPDQP